MINTFRAEWVRLLLGRTLVAVAVPLAVFPALITVLTFVAATGHPDAGPGQHLSATVTELAASDGYLVGLEKAATVIGVIVMVLFAVGFGADYSHGTLRNLLVRQPRRTLFLSGKLLAMLAFVAGGLVLAVATAAVAAWVAAARYDVSTAAWSGAPTEIAGAWTALVGSSIGWGITGAVLATVLRSVPAAVAIGAVWALPVESVLTSVWDSGNRWLPGSVFNAVAEQGTDALPLTTAVVLIVVYTGLAYLGAAGSLRSRDVLA